MILQRQIFVRSIKMKKEIDQIKWNKRKNDVIQDIDEEIGYGYDE